MPACLFELARDLDGLIAGACDGFFPVGIVGLNESGVLRELPRKLRHAFAERASCVLAGVPLGEADLLEKRVNRLKVGKEAPVEAAGVPADEDVAQVKDDGLDVIGHVAGLFYPRNGICGYNPALAGKKLSGVLH